MTKSGSAPARASRPWGWWAAALALLAPRLFHLGGPLDDPHSWRQCDTAFYSLDFVRHGIDLLRPSVCWLGAHRTLIFEFTLPEAISALLQRAFGVGEQWDRIVGLAFYLVATAYFHAALRQFTRARTAWLATLAWLVLPLGQFYSRAAHVDFAATAGAHALLYHGSRAARERSWRHAAAGGAWGALAAMIKAPYLLPMLGPLALAALSAAGLAGWAALGTAGLVTLIAFRLWRGWVDGVNAQAPDWYFLPGYYKEVNPLWWYFGEWKQRLDVASWARVLRRLLTEVATPPGVLIAFVAPLASAGLGSAGPAGAPRFGPRALVLTWSLGALAYLLVFFPLNLIHNYYQMPFLAPAALLVALGAEAMLARAAPAGVIALAVFFVFALLAPARLHYYQVDWLRVEAGREIRAATPAGDLLVACDHASGYSDPRLLYRADRVGWSLAIPDLTPDRLRRLRAEGAHRVAVVTDLEHPGLASPAFLASARVATMPVTHAGRRLGTLELFDLGRLPAP